MLNSATFASNLLLKGEHVKALSQHDRGGKEYHLNFFPLLVPQLVLLANHMLRLSQSLSEDVANHSKSDKKSEEREASYYLLGPHTRFACLSFESYILLLFLIKCAEFKKDMSKNVPYTASPPSAAGQDL